jgi:hypothetical protein
MLRLEIYFGKLVRGIIVIRGNDYGWDTVILGEATFENFFGSDWIETVG